MNRFKVITTADGNQHAITTAGGTRYDMYIIGGEPISFNIVERAAEAAEAAEGDAEAAKRSLEADGVKLSGVDVIVTASAYPACPTTSCRPCSLYGAAAGLIAEHAAAIAALLKEYSRGESTTALEDHAKAIQSISRTIVNQLISI